MMRPTTVKPALGRAAMALTLACLYACSKPATPEADKAAQTAATTALRPSKAPLTFSQETSDSTVTLTFPDAVKAFGDLHEHLYGDDEADLKAFMARAGKDHADLVAQGFIQPPYFKTIIWHLTAQTDNLISMAADIETDAGGAHPNSDYNTVLWDKPHNHEIEVKDLFAPSADLAPLNRYLCGAIEAARSRRAEKPVTQGGNCPRLTDGQVVLLPSTVPGKIGGLSVLYAPYDIGPYSEGAYDIRLPQSVVKPAIKAEYASDFAGDAAPDARKATPQANP